MEPSLESQNPGSLVVPQLGQNQESQSETETEFDSGLANQYLSSVEEADRAIVEKYIKGWDGQVTQKFQDYASKLKPYEELGVDIDSIKYAVQTMQWAEQDPKGFHEAVVNSLKEMGLMDDPENTPVGGSNLPEYEGLPDNFVSEFTSLKSELNELREFKSNLENERQQSSQQQQLDNLLKKLETDHGKFDQPAVMGRMLQGMTAEDAVKDWKKYIKELNTPAKTPPPVLSGGRTAVEQVDSSKIRNDKKARTSLVADLLNRMQD